MNDSERVYFLFSRSWNHLLALGAYNVAPFMNCVCLSHVFGIQGHIPAIFNFLDLMLSALSHSQSPHHSKTYLQSLETNRKLILYCEALQDMGPIWWPLRWKKSSAKIEICWHPQTRLNKLSQLYHSNGVGNLKQCFHFVMVRKGFMSKSGAKSALFGGR